MVLLDVARQKQILFVVRLDVVKVNHKIANVEPNLELEREVVLEQELERELVLERELGQRNNTQGPDQLHLLLHMEAGVLGVTIPTVHGVRTVTIVHIVMELGVLTVVGAAVPAELLTM